MDDYSIEQCYHIVKFYHQNTGFNRETKGITKIFYLNEIVFPLTPFETQLKNVNTV